MLHALFPAAITNRISFAHSITFFSSIENDFPEKLQLIILILCFNEYLTALTNASEDLILLELFSPKIFNEVMQEFSVIPHIP